jgi:phenylalanine-4-hydroxylase
MIQLLHLVNGEKQILFEPVFAEYIQAGGKAVLRI